MSVPDCGPVLPLPAHATVNSDKDVAFRGSVLYGCEAGYRLEGTARRVCGTEGQWDTPAPTCVGEFILAGMEGLVIARFLSRYVHLKRFYLNRFLLISFHAYLTKITLQQV